MKLAESFELGWDFKLDLHWIGFGIEFQLENLQRLQLQHMTHHPAVENEIYNSRGRDYQINAVLTTPANEIFNFKFTTTKTFRKCS